MQHAPILVSLALAALILWRNLPGALLFLWPGLVRARAAAEDDPRLDRELFAQMQEELAPLGFVRLGVHLESAPLRRAALQYDFVSPAEATFATAFMAGRDARLYLITALGDGAIVLTADHARIGVDRPDYLAGGIPGASPEELLAAHRRRVERLVSAGHQRLAGLDFEARVALARRWFAGKGAGEMRLRHANALLLSLIGVVLLVAVVRGALRALAG